MTGLKQFSYGLTGGIFGLVKSPFEGAAKGGVSGFFKGLGQGIIGTVMKPAAGIVDAFSSTTSGIGLIAKKKVAKNLSKRSFPPKPFYKDKVLRPYDRIEAKA